MIRGAAHLGIISVVLATGCLSTPPYSANGRDGGPTGDAPTCTGAPPSQPSAGGLELTTVDDRAVVRWGSVAMTFADDANRNPFPISLTIERGTMEQLIGAQSTSCNDEDTVGIAVYPVYTISGRTAATSSIGHGLDRQAAGPAYTELKTNWRHMNVCGDHIGIGHTVWSFFPTGRINRYDYFRPATTTQLVASQCMCPQGISTLRITSYLSLDSARIQSYTEYNEENEGSTPMPSVGDEDVTSFGGCFITTGGHRFAYRFNTFAGEPTSRLRQAASTVMLVRDLQNGGSVAMNAEYETLTQYLIEDGTPTSCPALNAELDDHDEPVGLRIDGDTPVDVQQDLTGVYPVADHTGPLTVRASNGRIGESFAIRVKLIGAQSITTQRTSTDGRTDGRVWWQREADGTFYVVFEHGLENGGSYTITPEC